MRIEFPDRRVLTFDFPVIELAKLSAHDYVRKENASALALAARMSFGKEEQEGLILDFAATLGKLPPGKEAADRAIRYFFAYCQLEDKRALNVEEQMSKLFPAMISEKALDRLNPFCRIWEKRGIKRGRQSGEALLVLRLLRRRLGRLPEARRRAIENLSLPKIEALGEALLDFRSPEDLTRWIQKNAAPAASRKTPKAPKRSRTR